MHIYLPTAAMVGGHAGSQATCEMPAFWNQKLWKEEAVAGAKQMNFLMRSTNEYKQMIDVCLTEHEHPFDLPLLAL